VRCARRIGETLKGLLFKGFVLAVLVAAVVVPAASAKSGTGVRLSVLPLPKSAIGPAAKSLPLQPDSGVASHYQLAGRGEVLLPTRSLPGTPRDKLAKLGRISGYALDYGLGASGGADVTEVYTYVDQYKTIADAKRGLALWRSLDRGVTGWIGQSGGGGLAFAITAAKVAPVGSRRFAFLVSYSAANIAPIFGLDEQFTEDRYEADVTVWAGSAAAAKKLAPSLARKLDARIRLAREGRLHAKPVKLPTPGPPQGGPDLTALALHLSDFGFNYPGYQSNFVPYLDPTALSAYHLTTCPPGTERYCPNFLYQDIEWCPSANQASFVADFWAAWGVRGRSSVDLSGVGDGARGFFGTGAGVVVLSSGQLMELIEDTGSMFTGLQTSDVQKLAHTAANYINAAGLGS